MSQYKPSLIAKAVKHLPISMGAKIALMDALYWFWVMEWSYCQPSRYDDGLYWRPCHGIHHKVEVY